MYRTTAHRLTVQAANLTRRLAYARDRAKDTDAESRTTRLAAHAATRYERRDRNARHTERVLASQAIRTRDAIRDQLRWYDDISEWLYTERRERLAYALSRAERRADRRIAGLIF